MFSDQTWLTASQREKGNSKLPSMSVFGEAQFALFGVSLQFSSAFGFVCLWFSLTPVMMAGPARLRAQVGAPSKPHSLLICMDQGLWAKRAVCPAAEAGGSYPGLPSSSPSSQHIAGPGPAAVVHHSTSEGKTGLISTPSQSRSVLSPARWSILPVRELATDFASGTDFWFRFLPSPEI